MNKREARRKAYQYMSVRALEDADNLHSDGTINESDADRICEELLRLSQMFERRSRPQVDKE